MNGATREAKRKPVYSPDRLAGLAFYAEGAWYYFRTSCGFSFNSPLDSRRPYALIDAATDRFVGIRARGHFVSSEGYMPEFRVMLLRPLVENLDT